MPVPAHNAIDSRCRYTWGVERCPGPGAVRVGREFFCEFHAHWAVGERNQDLGRELLRDAQERFGRLRAKAAAGVPQAVASTQGATAADAFAAMRASLEQETPAALPDHLAAREWDDAWLTELVRFGVQLYRDRRAALEQLGVARQEAHELAVGLVFVAACMWGWL